MLGVAMHVFQAGAYREAAIVASCEHPQALERKYKLLLKVYN